MLSLSTRLALAVTTLLLGLGNHAEQSSCPTAVALERAPQKIVTATTSQIVAPTNTFALGQRGYRRSCVHCHGIQPKGLRYQDRSRFTNAVLHGSGQMPALGFKLTAREVELIRRYVAACAPDYQRC